MKTAENVERNKMNRPLIILSGRLCYLMTISLLMGDTPFYILNRKPVGTPFSI